MAELNNLIDRMTHEPPPPLNLNPAVFQARKFVFYGKICAVVIGVLLLLSALWNLIWFNVFGMVWMMLLACVLGFVALNIDGRVTMYIDAGDLYTARSNLVLWMILGIVGILPFICFLLCYLELDKLVHPNLAPPPPPYMHQPPAQAPAAPAPQQEATSELVPVAEVVSADGKEDIPAAEAVDDGSQANAK